MLSLETWRERLSQYRRTIEISRKPDRNEFLSAAKITALGMFIIGLVGFLMFVLYHLIFTIGGLGGVVA